MKTCILLIFFCMNLSFAKIVSASENRAHRTNLPLCLGGICLKQNYESLSDLPGNWFNRTVEKCGNYSAVTIEKKGKLPLEKVITYAEFFSPKKTLINIFVHRKLHYKFSSQMSAEEQILFVENILIQKYGRPYHVQTSANKKHKIYYYDKFYKIMDDADTITISQYKGKERILVNQKFGPTVSSYERCLSRKKKKEKEQNLLPD